MTLGERIRYYRRLNKMSQDQLGKIIKVEPGVISNYENGKYKPSADTIVGIAKAFSISTDDLLMQSSQEKAEDVIKEKEWILLFKEIMKLPSEEREALKTVVKAVTANRKPIKKKISM